MDAFDLINSKIDIPRFAEQHVPMVAIDIINEFMSHKDRDPIPIVREAMACWWENENCHKLAKLSRAGLMDEFRDHKIMVAAIQEWNK